MTPHEERPRTTIKQETDFQLGSLPQSEQVSVLVKLLAEIAGNITVEQRRVLTCALFLGTTEETDLPSLTPTQIISAMRDAFIEKYKIRALNSSHVALTLPAGTTRVEFLKMAQALSITLHACDPRSYPADQAVYPNTLEIWRSEQSFTATIKDDLLLKIDGNVKGSIMKTRDEQELKGWNNVAQEDLAVAHIAFYILTGKDLFDGNIVRAAVEALFYEQSGLGVVFHYDDDKNPYVSASCSLMFPN